MKKWLSILLTVTMLFAALAAPAAMAEKAALTPGAYEATVAGRNGNLTLTVTVDETSIKEIVIGEHVETPGVADPALTTLPEQIVQYQSIAVDAITGATMTSEAILAAVADCIAQAGGNADEWKTSVEKVAGEDIEMTADVIVIGGGGAGLAAAATAGEAGASVILVEKAAALGGNTILSGGIFNTADADMQQKIEMSESTRNELISYLDYKEEDFGDFAGTLTVLKQQINDYVASGATYLFDTPELHMIQTYTGSKRVGIDGTVIEPDFELINVLCNSALDSWHWLEEIGTPTIDSLSIGVGALWMRTHSVDGGANGALPLIQSLDAHARKQGTEIIFNTEATEFIMDNGRVTGVIAKKDDGTKVILHANKGVVLATGGFAGNVAMVNEYNNYWPDLTLDAKHDNTTTINGDGIRMAQAIGANTVGMGFAQMLPTCAALDGQAGKGVGSQLYVNKEGKRYVNETSERDVLVKGAQAQTGGIFYGVGDAKMYNHRQQGEAKVADSVAKGYAFVGETLEEAAQKAGVDAAALVETVAKFNTYVENENDPDFGRYGFMGKVEEAPFMIVAMAPALHHTMGGLEINTETQVINTEGQVIPGLYAAGEVCGGIHAGNRLGGNAIADIIVFGRIAGANAAAGK